ncbi:MAG: lipid-A-disaccharide synthase [Paludibacteraceae bacterium]|nr:lipid-A-disaccharide synthase [Paludibacteraceae bacterium]
MKYFLIAGEASGDMHAARLMAALRHCDAEATFAGLGGDKMQAEGCKLYRHYKKMAYMGYVEVLMHLRDIRANIRITEQALLSEQPDELILIDYPGFNLHIAKFAKHHLPKTKITYYIPPKVWAWKRWRVHTIGKYCDRILGIFPFEPDFYAGYGYTCTYVGNPTAEMISDFRSQKSEVRNQISDVRNQKEYIALLPGSRRHEITDCLPKMLAAAAQVREKLPNIQRIVVTQAPGIERALYERFCAGYEHVELTENTYDAVRHAAAAVVNSGTATLETALIGCPQVAVYHLAFGHVLGLLRPIMFRIPHFTLVNIIAGREIIRELLVYEFTVEATRDELLRLLTHAAYAEQMRAGYEQVRQILGDARAAENAAKEITSGQHPAG